MRLSVRMRVRLMGFLFGRARHTKKELRAKTLLALSQSERWVQLLLELVNGRMYLV